MKTLTWTGARGNKIELRAYCKITMQDKTVDADGYEIKVGEEPHTDANLELYVDGKKIDSSWDITFWKIIDTRDGYKKIWGLPVGMSDEQAVIVEKFLKEVIEAGKSEEVKAYEAKKAETTKAELKAEAQRIIEKAAKQEKIMTKAEYKEWAKRYNNAANEGGDGYIPELVTVEQLEWAKKTLVMADVQTNIGGC